MRSITMLKLDENILENEFNSYNLIEEQINL